MVELSPMAEMIMAIFFAVSAIGGAIIIAYM